MMGAAANSVSRTLNKRMSDFEKEESATRREERAMDYALEKEDTLGKRRSERKREKELESYVATINSFLPPEEASKLLAQVTDHSGMGIIASQMTSLANNQINPYDVYKINKESFSPKSIKSGTIPYGSLFIPPKKPKEPKYVDSLDKMLAINLQEQFGAKTRDDLVRLRFEQEKIEQRIIEKHGLTNKGTSDEEYKPFSKEPVTNIVTGDYHKELKIASGLNESSPDFSDRYNKWLEGNALTILQTRFTHSRKLDNFADKLSKQEGVNLENEALFVSSANEFKRGTLELVGENIRTAEIKYSKGNQTSNQSLRINIPEELRIPTNISNDPKNPKISYRINYSKLMKTVDGKYVYGEEWLKKNYKNKNTEKGDIIPFIDNGRLHYFIDTGAMSYGSNIFYEKPMDT